ncbi:hypothetical protein FUAX_50750 (plasmid) [Fulvitalea axinellae]|uniref:Lipoprotein n=1 Tax=Fulvitalea axinellae TaxID=1182444 RepID=A0AAU9CR68_9BACT|nr:hypothetical protein FUAX_50750 [Fulvitalea axinellae]
MKRLSAILLLLTLAFSSCSPTVDASSEKSFKASIKQLKESLSKEERKEFAECVKLIMTQNISVKDLLSKPKAYAREKLDGKTVSDILKEGKELKKELEKKRKKKTKKWFKK